MTDLLKRIEALEKSLKIIGGANKDEVLLQKAHKMENETKSEDEEKITSVPFNNNQDMNSTINEFRLKLEERINQVELRINNSETENESKLLKIIIDWDNKTKERTDKIEGRILDSNNFVQKLKEKVDDNIKKIDSRLNDSETKNKIKSIGEKLLYLEEKISEERKT
jgi:hypothetical protein